VASVDEGMRTPIHLIALVCLAALLGCSSVGEAAGNDAPRPILLELFTSQGCSSCPAADALLPQWKREYGDQVVVLAFHVDYWNELGWPDPFSRPEWTARQQDYARAGWARRVYTPQMVVDGRDHVVGSQRGRVVRAIAAAQQKATRTVELTGAAHREGQYLMLEAKMDGLPDATASATVYAAVRDGAHTTRVPRGENAGRVLEDAYVVRALHRFAPQSGAQPRRARIRVEPDWRADALDVVFFARDPQAGEIIGVTAPISVPIATE